jgi:osmotically inducible protein OsmC
MKRTAKAHWAGNLNEGQGKLTAQSGVLFKANYGFKSRFEEGEKGTNPEELLAAAHAGCFTMAVCAALTQKGLNPVLLETEATVTMENLIITGVHLNIKGSVPGINAEEFKEVTLGAEKNCPISKALSTTITSEAHLES